MTHGVVTERMTSQRDDPAPNMKRGTGLVRTANAEISFAQVELHRQPEPWGLNHEGEIRAKNKKIWGLLHRKCWSK